MFYLANLHLRKGHWTKVGRYRMYGQTLRFDDAASLMTVPYELVASNVNYFLSDRDDPVAVDVGANIGDSFDEIVGTLKKAGFGSASSTTIGTSSIGPIPRRA